MTLNAWVSGSRGFVGTELVKSLMKHKYAVTCVSNSISEESAIMHVDYASKERIRSALETAGVPDLFFHLGWDFGDQILMTGFGIWL